MKKNVLVSIIIIAIAMMTNPVVAQIKVPAASPSATLKQAIGLGEITIEYSRPGLKGRDMFSELTTEGEVWRTGANMATKIVFSEDVTVEGNKIPAGTYSLWSIPGKETWTIILNKKMSWGTQYDASQDLVRFQVPRKEFPISVESFMFYTSELTDNSCNIGFVWENTQVEFKVQTEVDSKVMAQIEEVMADPSKVQINDYYSAALYYLNNKKDLNKALGWANKYLEKNQDKYWAYRLRSLIHGALGNYKEAISDAKKSTEMATEAGNKDYVRLNKKSISEWEAKL